MNNCYFIVRHGESVLNEKKCHQGWISRNPLTPRGRLQAEEAVKKLEGQKIELIYTSPLLRTKQTARIVANHLGLPISFCSRLKDYRRCKKHEGLHVSQYSILPDYLLWKQTTEIDKSFCLPEGESLDIFEKRIVNFAKWLDKSFRNKSIAIITHDGVAQYLMQYWLGRTIEANSVGNAQVYKVNPETKSMELI